MADPRDQLPTDSVLLQKWEGLKNTVGAERLTPTQLQRALNIDIDDAGQIRRRRGYTRVSTGNFHSLYTAPDGTIFGVKDGALGIIYPNYTFETLLPGVGPDYLAYVTVGDSTYFSSATTSGVVGPSKIVSQWGAPVDNNTWLSPVINPTSTLAPTKGKFIGAPPMATALTWWNGRIYLANEKTVWATELFLYDYVDKTKNFLQFEAPVTAIGAVTNGLYIGTTEKLYFVSGTFAEGLKRLPVSNYGVLPRSMISVPAELVDPKIPPGDVGHSRNAVVFMTPYGIVAGFDGGACHNLTQNDVLLPEAQDVAPLFRRQDGVNQYIGVADSRGTPSANTRIGDYVDAVIRRAPRGPADLADVVWMGDTAVAEII